MIAGETAVLVICILVGIGIHFYRKYRLTYGYGADYKDFDFEYWEKKLEEDRKASQSDKKDGNSDEGTRD